MLLKQAVALHTKGKLKQAEACYKKILSSNPNDVDALYYLGTLYAQTGSHSDAVYYLGLTLDNKPEYVEAYNNLGLALQGLDRKEEAKEKYYKALELNSTYLDALKNLTTLLSEERANSEIRDLLASREQLVSRQPGLCAYLGQAYEQTGDTDNAELWYHRSLTLSPAQKMVLIKLLAQYSRTRQSKKTLELLANSPLYGKGDVEIDLYAARALLDAGDLSAASASFEKILQTSPDCMSAIEGRLRIKLLKKELNGRAELINKLRQNVESPEYFIKEATLFCEFRSYNDAISSINEFLARGGDEKKGINLRASYYVFSNQFNMAKKDYERLLELDPNSVEARVGLGVIALNSKDVLVSRNDSVRYFEKALELDPRSAASLNNLGLIYRTRGDVGRAIECYGRLIELDPNEAEGRFNYALALLSVGDLEKGWEEYEWRWKTRDQVRKLYNYPEWYGEDLSDKVVFIFGEQGIGDEILFASCFQDIIKIAKLCVIECDDRLVGLFSRSFGQAMVVPRKIDIKRYLADNDVHIDFQVAAGSLPRFFRKTKQSFANPKPYLVADSLRVEFWRSHLNSSPLKLNVGFSWVSNKQRGVSRHGLAGIGYWWPLFFCNDLSLFSLQYTSDTDDIKEIKDRWGVDVSRFTGVDLFNDFDEVSAIISALDLVISIGNVVSSLAGALGTPQFRTRELKGPRTFVLGESEYPWYLYIKSFFAGHNEGKDVVAAAEKFSRSLFNEASKSNSYDLDGEKRADIVKRLFVEIFKGYPLGDCASSQCEEMRTLDNCLDILVDEINDRENEDLQEVVSNPSCKYIVSVYPIAISSCLLDLADKFFKAKNYQKAEILLCEATKLPHLIPLSYVLRASLDLVTGREVELSRDIAWRWSMDVFPETIAAKAWAGEIEKGISLFIHKEVGGLLELLNLHFVSYLLQSGVQVGMRCDKELMPVVDRVFPSIKLYENVMDAVDKYDYEVYEADIALYQKDRDEPGWNAFRINPDNIYVEKWGAKLKDDSFVCVCPDIDDGIEQSRTLVVDDFEFDSETVNKYSTLVIMTTEKLSEDNLGDIKNRYTGNSIYSVALSEINFEDVLAILFMSERVYAARNRYFGLSLALGKDTVLLESGVVKTTRLLRTFYSSLLTKKINDFSDCVALRKVCVVESET